MKLYMCGGEKPVSQYPLGLGYLKSNCEGADLMIDIVDSPEKLRDCDMIGLSSCAWGIKEAVKILYSAGIPVVIGGQCSLWTGLSKYPFQNIILGEGEQVLKKIATGVPRQLVETHRIQDLDSLKFPERGRCDNTVPILTSRGCPYDCSFCTSRSFWGGARYHSPEYIIEEARYVASRYPEATELYILDDLFAVNRPRLEKICELWIGAGLQKRFTLRGFVRAGSFDLGMASIMKIMGFSRIRFGAESGSDRILDILHKRATVADNQRVIDTARAVGLPVSASFMQDIPSETLAEAKMTTDFIEKNKGKLEVEGWYAFRAFPGSGFYADEDPTSHDMRVRE